MIYSGIAGYISFKKRRLDASIISEMIHNMAHRGRAIIISIGDQINICESLEDLKEVSLEARTVDAYQGLSLIHI